MATTTNYGWTTPDNTDLVKDGASAIRTLGSSIDTTLKAQIDAQIPDAVLTTTGDVIYASGASTPARLGIGSTGQYLSVSGGVPAWATSLVSKNSMINGGMDIWQRGTSFTGSTSAFCADRWQAYRNTTGSTFSRQATSDTTNLPNIQYCVRAQRDNGTTATNAIWVSQTFESVNSIPYAGKTVTVSFYARKGANYSAASSALTVVLSSGTGTDQNIFSGFTGSANVVNSTATLTTTWQRFTYTGTVAATATQLAFYVAGTLVGTAGAADYYEITGVQLEEGSIATPFNRAGANYGGELALCQRYYLRNTANTAYGGFASGSATSTTVADTIYALPVQLRVAPTSIEFSNVALSDGVTVRAVTGLVSSHNAAVSGILQATVASGLTQFRPYVLLANNNASAYVAWVAEL